MAPTSRGTSPGPVGSTLGVEECGVVGLRSHVRCKSTDIKLIKKPLENPDDSEFDDFKDSDEGPDLTIGEEPRSLLDYIRTHAKEWRGAAFD